MAAACNLVDLQSSPRSFWTAGQHKQFSNTCPGRCSGWGRLSPRGLQNTSAEFLCSHYRMPFHNLWGWWGDESSNTVTVSRRYADWRSGWDRICCVRSLPADLGAWDRQPPSSSPVKPCWELYLALKGTWPLGSCCGLWCFLSLASR